MPETQLSSLKTPGNEADAQNVHYARFAVRRLTAEQLADDTPEEREDLHGRFGPLDDDIPF